LFQRLQRARYVGEALIINDPFLFSLLFLLLFFFIFFFFLATSNTMRTDTPYLDPRLQLLEQGVMMDDAVILLQRNFQQPISAGDSEARKKFLFAQARAHFLGGEWNSAMTPEQLARFAALLCQLHFGNAAAGTCTHHAMRKATVEFMPTGIKLSRSTQQAICDQHLLLHDQGPSAVMAAFLQLWQELDIFGLEFFTCHEVASKKPSLV
jgi:hypothetical protein